MNNIVCLMGPTACGKTALAVELTQEFPVDIISVDSAMVYRGMDIGTAKPVADIIARAPHRLIDIRNPNESYSVADFCQDAFNEIDLILKKKRIPLLVGGTMLYFRGLQQGLSSLPQASEDVREAITLEAHAKGWKALHDELTTIDPDAANRIHPNDPQRLTRALEVYRLTGKSLTSHWNGPQPKTISLNFINIAIMPEDRNHLHQRIANRFDAMLQQGFVEEVRTLIKKFQLTHDAASMRAVGYRQVFNYLAGGCHAGEMREKSIVATRQLAKRQMTWLRHWAGARYFSENSMPIIKNLIKQITQGP